MYRSKWKDCIQMTLDQYLRSFAASSSKANNISTAVNVNIFKTKSFKFFHHDRCAFFFLPRRSLYENQFFLLFNRIPLIFLYKFHSFLYTRNTHCIFKLFFYPL